MPKYVAARVATAKLGVSLRTLLRWEETGKIQTVKTPNGQRRYDIDSIVNLRPTIKPTILYARVSSASQKADLTRQIEFLQSTYPGCEVIKDTGSGLNFKRKGLLTLLERILSGNVGMVVVAHKDRLCRFGFDLISWLAKRSNCEILVLNNHALSPEREMLEDVLAIIHVFSCRLYGLRKYKKNIKEDIDLQSIPEGETKKVWMQRVHAYRKVYNNAIAYLNQQQGFEYINTKGKKTTGKKAFRSFCKTLGTEIIPQWCKDLGIAHALDNALFEAYTAWSKTLRGEKFIGKDEKKKPNPNAGKKIAKFRSIRDKNQTIQFDPLAYKDGHWMINTSNGLEKAEFWGQDYCLINYDNATELTYNKGRWCANFPVEVEVEEKPKNQKVIALDPGLRTFLTGFDGNAFTEFASGDFAKIARLCKHLDRLQSKHDKAKGGKFNRWRYKIKKAMERVRTRIKNLRSEVHKQVASHLARNYDVIYLPTFETSQMVVKSKRKIRSKSARAMMTWAFHQFSQTLQHLCNRYGSRLVRVTEEYTSKTCTSCGHIHHKLGGNKTFKCPQCGYQIKRDFNGALGILLKALWDTTCLSSAAAESVVFELSSNVE